MSAILEAKPVIQSLKTKIQEEINSLKAGSSIPTIGIIRVGSRPDDVYYENSIIKKCESIGILTKKFTLEENINMEQFIEVLNKVNTDSEIHGIMIFRPLPKQLDEEILKYMIDPAKDIDCMSPLNLAKVFAGDMSGLVPCTPAAVMETLKYYRIELQGANVVVVGRSMVVGKPLSMMLLKENATVTICHSKTKNMKDICKSVDVVVAAIGKAKFFNEKYVNPKSIVIDVGINNTGEGKMCGDVDFEAVIGRVKAITPVPGGVGSVTTTVLLMNMVKAYKNLMLQKSL